MTLQNDLYGAWTAMNSRSRTTAGASPGRRSRSFTAILCALRGQGAFGLDDDYDVRDLDNEDWYRNCAHGYHEDGVCECEIGMIFPPGERRDAIDLITPARRELDRQERFARMKHRHALAEEFRSRAG